MGAEDGLNALVIGLREMIDIVLILGILLLLVVILKIIEKGYRVKLELRRKDRNLFYKREIKRLVGWRDSPEKILDKINIVARGFFKEAFNLPYHMEYLELAEEFRKRGIREGVSFCKLISELNYSGEEISKSKLDAAVKLLKEITKNKRILNEEEKSLIEKKKKLLNIKPGKKPTKEKEKTEGNKETLKKPPTFRAKSYRGDINKINWKYKLRIMMLKLRGKLPASRKVELKRE